jgi:ATP-dependent Clp protease ATP-binding subunit ClpC
LARGELQCVGATTLDEYRENIEKDGALERRFQKVMVDGSTPDETLEILQNLKSRYEDHHKVVYTDEALQTCVTLADRYVTDREFPDKAIDIMDEVGARAQINVNFLKLSKNFEQKPLKLKIRRFRLLRVRNMRKPLNYVTKNERLSKNLNMKKKSLIRERMRNVKKSPKK